MPADDVYEFAITTPAGTAQAAPLITPTIIPSGIVTRIEWRVPAGALGAMGWRIGMGKVPVIPRNAGGWIIAHDKTGWFDLHNQPDSGDWSVTTYNTGSFPHLLSVIFHAVVRRPLPRELALIGAGELYGEPPPDWTG